MSGWATAELKNAQLGDVRRTKRLILIVDNLSKKTSATVPEACGTWAATKATYDFWDSPYIKPEQIRQAHIDSTLKRITKQDWILAIQDTTEFNDTNHPATQGMGYLDSKYSRGLKVHSTLLVRVP
ncbi:transposase DNA-binding-containing protein [Moorena sp. SIO4G3]|uniref:IS4/Tn5 family transposase DNA-binding protein n=1 Tax=Moorena sp. SIO4G3 TaxID=2607821 RepID=UPI00142C4E89|nr:transposase DNA-binding-containing protein [Moorena sp. SIO4G3]NEO80153.1 transposase [Moorena sp. SIO4G3]